MFHMIQRVNDRSILKIKTLPTVERNFSDDKKNDFKKSCHRWRWRTSGAWSREVYMIQCVIYWSISSFTKLRTAKRNYSSDNTKYWNDESFHCWRWINLNLHDPDCNRSMNIDIYKNSNSDKNFLVWEEKWRKSELSFWKRVDFRWTFPSNSQSTWSRPWSIDQYRCL